MAEHVERALIGAGVGTVVGLVLQPFDVVKTRQQRALLRGEPTVSLLAGFRRLVADGGGSPGGVVRSLWRGSVPTIARMGPGAAIYFSVVAAARKRGTAGDKPTMAENAMVGMLARATVTVTMSPVSVLKTRVEGADLAHTGARGASSAAAVAIKSSSPSSSPSSSSASSSAVRRVGAAALSVPRALATIARTEGIGALYRGVTPTLMRDCPHAAIHLAAYEALKPLLQALVDAATTGRSASSSSSSSSSSPAPADESIPRPVHAAVLPVAGLCAGVFSSVLTHPPDVLKTHAQLRGTTHTAHGGTLASSASPTAREYWAVARDIWRTRGWRGAYVGLAPRLVRRGLLPAMSWPLYEIAARLRGV